MSEDGIHRTPQERAPRKLGNWTAPDQARAQGLRLRELVPHRLHDHPAGAAGRPEVADFVVASNRGRLAHLIPLRIGRMSISPFAFFRGVAGLMAYDLADTPVSGPVGQICGDAHGANFGLYGMSHGRIVMDINDFDETIVGPWEWDLKRLATSLVLAGRVGGVSDKGCRKAARHVVRSYRHAMAHLSGLPFLEAWNALGDEAAISKAMADELHDDFEKAADKAARNTSSSLAAKWTRRDSEDNWRFTVDPPTRTAVDDETAAGVVAGLDDYVDTLYPSRRQLIGRYQVCDVAFRVVGTGSVGLRSYVILLHGNGDDALILQAKEAVPSALVPYLPTNPVAHEGARIVQGTRSVQADTDILLGWTTIAGRPFFVRQFRNRKGEIDPATLERDHLDDYGRLAGALLARAHARTFDSRLLNGYFEDGAELDTAIERYAVAYADQTERDYDQFMAAVRDGRLPADT